MNIVTVFKLFTVHSGANKITYQTLAIKGDFNYQTLAIPHKTSEASYLYMFFSIIAEGDFIYF